MIPTPAPVDYPSPLNYPPWHSWPRGTPPLGSGSPGPGGASGRCRTGTRRPVPSGQPRRWRKLSGTPPRIHGAPQPLYNKGVVGIPPLPAHADLHAAVLQDMGELPAGELAPLVGVEHLRPTLPQRLLQGVDA